ncbi:MAG TPA: HAD hydrolase family protein [Longimicrobiaceae bacterium]|nr:HAD hydrolase family protein [Longimicrobiaceae bacterium]
MVRLICIDVDGTLVGTGGRVPPQVWDAAERVRARGIRLAVCSGRPAMGLAREYAHRLDPAGWHVFQNGASIVHLPSGRSRSTPLPAETVRMLVDRARATGRVLELYDDVEYRVESTDDRAVRHAGLLGVAFTPRDLLTLPGAAVRAQWLVQIGDEARVMNEPHGGLLLSPSLSPVMPDTTFVNATPAGVDKASAVRALAAELGVPMEEVMMVGDGINDLGVLRAVGHAVAMANAEPEVLEMAPRHVGHVDDGGLAEALDLALTL